MYRKIMFIITGKILKLIDIFFILLSHTTTTQRAFLQHQLIIAVGGLLGFPCDIPTIIISSVIVIILF